MANIPVGNFGRSTPGQVSPGSASGDFGQGMARAIQGLGQTISAIGDYREQQKTEMARAKAVNAGYKHELFAAETVDEIRKKISTGELKYQDAESYYDNKLSAFPREKIDGLDAVDNERFDGLFARNAARYKQDVGALALKAEQDDYKNQFVQGLDTLGKQRQLPGADMDAINSKADVLSVMAQKAGIEQSQYTKYIQDFKDASWYQHATERAMKAEASNDVASLQQLQHDLTADNGYYTAKMDTEKRNAVLKGVTFDLDRIRQRQEMAAAKVEIKAERALMQFDALVSTGATPSQEAIERARSAVQGTPFAGEFQQRLEFADQVQEVLKQPIDKQLELAQQVERQAMESADNPQQVAQAKRLASAINANVKTLTTDPLAYIENREGTKFDDLPLDALADMSGAPAAAEAIASRLQERAESIAALEKKNGMRIDNALLKPHEVDKLTTIIASKEATIEEKQRVLQSLKAVTGDTATYKQVLQQIAPKSPVMAYAGAVSASARDIEYDAGLFSASQTFKPEAVASTMLKGERVINERSFEIPSLDKLQTEFSSQIGNAYRDRPDALQADLQAVRAYYVGAVSERDSPSKELNTKLMKEAIGVIVGAKYDAGDTTVLAPFGMSESEFSNKLETAWQVESARLGMDGTPLDVFGLRPVGSGKYAVFAGNKVLPGQNGQPLILDVGE